MQVVHFYLKPLDFCDFNGYDIDHLQFKNEWSIAEVLV